MNKPRVVKFFSLFLKQLNIATMRFFVNKLHHEFGNQTIEVRRLVSENQIYTATVVFGAESLKSLQGQENLLLNHLQLKTPVQNVRFLSQRVFFL